MSAEPDAARIAGWVRAIDDLPEAAHRDFTPAVHALVQAGLAALPLVLPLLQAPAEATRMRAQRVFEGVLRDWVRTRVPLRALDRRAARTAQAIWQRNGDYDWHLDEAARAAAVQRWRDWLAAPALPPEAGTTQDDRS